MGEMGSWRAETIPSKSRSPYTGEPNAGPRVSSETKVTNSWTVLRNERSRQSNVRPVVYAVTERPVRNVWPDVGDATRTEVARLNVIGQRSYTRIEQLFKNGVVRLADLP